MLTKSKIIEVIKLSLESLHRSGVIESAIAVDEQTVLLGVNSNLDSMGFVTLIADVEERLSSLLRRELFVVLPDLEEMYPDAKLLTAEMFANFILHVTGIGPTGQYAEEAKAENE